MKLILLRHGKTKGNLERRYIGTTDESLCEEGIRELVKNKERGLYNEQVQKVYISPLKRCRETAELLYPNLEHCVIEDFRECDFGEFENKNYLELASDSRYQAFLDSNGTLPFPKGESMEQMQSRCALAAERIFFKAENECIAFVVHGGTIMSIASQFAVPKQDYFSYQVGNGEGYQCAVLKEEREKPFKIQVIEKIQSVYER